MNAFVRNGVVGYVETRTPLENLVHPDFLPFLCRSQRNWKGKWLRDGFMRMVFFRRRRSRNRNHCLSFRLKRRMILPLSWRHWKRGSQKSRLKWQRRLQQHDKV